MPAGINLSDFYYLLPEIVLTAGALLLLLADLMAPRDKQSILAWVTLAVLGGDGRCARSGRRRQRSGLARAHRRRSASRFSSK